MIGVFSLQKFAFRLFVALLFLFTIHFSLFTSDVHAQGACAPQPGLTTKEAIDKINKCVIEKNTFDDKIFNLNQLAGTTDSIYNLLTGKSQLHPETDTVTAGTGALAATGKLVATLYSVPPVSGVSYFASQIQKFNPIQPVYAQEGIGFKALIPVQPIWTVFRNAAYVGFVIIFIIIGFMIMFRAHISPQAVATVQDSLPRIVVALILVTFSYALAGLMIDLMFLFLNIVINLLQQTPLLTDQGDIIFKKSVFGVTFAAWDEIVSSVADAMANIIDQLVKIPVLNKILGFFGGGLAGIIVGIAILFVMFRVFIMLLMAYVMIIILTMFAPFFFLIQALPGNTGAREWFKQMAANVAVFPTVALMFIFAGILGGLEALGGSGASQFSPQQIGQFPLLAGDIKFDALGKLIGLGFLLMTPEAANLVKNAIGAKGPAFGPAAAGALGAGAAVIGKPLGTLASPVTGALGWRAREAVYYKLPGARQPPETQVKPGGGEPSSGLRP